MIEEVFVLMYIPSCKEEEEYLRKYNPNDWPKPSVAADIAVFGYSAGKLYLLLVERGNYPYRGCYALPGGFANMDEDVIETASRELEEETGLSGMYIEHISVWGKPGRDPRDRTITALHLALIDKAKAKVQAGDDARSARWFEITGYIENRDYFETGQSGAHQKADIGRGHGFSAAGTPDYLLWRHQTPAGGDCGGLRSCV